jgi:transposase
MAHLSPEVKEVIVLKAINPGSKSLGLIAQENSAGYSSPQKWLRNYRDGKPLQTRSKGGDATTRELTPAEQFDHILATHTLDEVSLGQYCRQHGLYSHQLTQWRESFMKTQQSNSDLKLRVELKALKAENKQLNRELRRKDKALAEASALLVMKKKVDLIWGVDEDN